MGDDSKKVVWFEGMTLDPHHFQQWDRYQQNVLNTRLRGIAPNGWGLTHFQINEERLANGQFAVTECAGIMPDGLGFDVPEDSPAPKVRNVDDHFPATDETLRVLLAVPSHRPNGRNVQLQASDQDRAPRFIAESASVRDENTGTDKRPVEVAHTNVQVRFASEAQQGYTTLPLAEVERTGSGFQLSNRFVPPCLSIQASGRLQELTRQMLELLVSKSGDLSDFQEKAFAQRELSPSDITSLNLLGTLNAYIPRLNQYHTHGEHHPQALLHTLTGLAGQLSTYVETVPVAPRDLPTYDHTAPTAAFQRIESILRQMLGEATPSADYQRIGMSRTRENVLQTDVEGPVLDDAQLFLVTRSDQHSESQLMNALPDMLRVAAPNNIDDVLQSYTQALNVEATRRLPVNMPVDNQATYFRLEKRGPFWESIREEEGIAIFVPSDFQDVDVELMAAR